MAILTMDELKQELMEIKLKNGTGFTIKRVPFWDDPVLLNVKESFENTGEKESTYTCIDTTYLDEYCKQFGY